MPGIAILCGLTKDTKEGRKAWNRANVQNIVVKAST